jgi:RNA polymerase sigma factor (TIGR02999 family)
MMSDVTQILVAIERGEATPAEDLLPLVYNELRRLAAHKLSHEAPGQTLQATALVHEAWLRLAGPAQKNPSWNGRRHFFNAAAEAMRRILIDRARRKKNERHGGSFHRVGVDAADIAAPLPDDQLLALHEALDELDRRDPEVGELVKLRFFVGLTQAQAAETLGLSRGTAERAWSFARAWLFDRIRMEQT